MHCEPRGDVGIKRFELCTERGGGGGTEEGQGLRDVTAEDPFRLDGFNIL